MILVGVIRNFKRRIRETSDIHPLNLVDVVKSNFSANETVLFFRFECSASFLTVRGLESDLSIHQSSFLPECHVQGITSYLRLVHIRNRLCSMACAKTLKE